MTIGPITDPNKAVNMTKTAVTAGIPPIISETFIAIGVVTDLGTRLSIRSSFSLKSFAINAVDRIAIQQPTATLIMISTAYFFKTGKYLYSGIAKATVAGWSMSVNKRPPALYASKGTLMKSSRPTSITGVTNKGDAYTFGWREYTAFAPK